MLQILWALAGLLKVWEEQLARINMCVVLKCVADINRGRALEYEWYNRKHWYEPNARMLASMLSILGRIHQVPIAKEIFNRAEPSMGNCVQVYNAMMGVYVRQGDCDKVQILLNLMKERGYCLDLITYNTIINARCKARLMPGMSIQPLQAPETCLHKVKSKAHVWMNSQISLQGRILGKEGKAIDYFNILQRQSLIPNTVTFNAVLYAFQKTGRVNEFAIMLMSSHITK
ncbi:hypothetical protein L7F22_049001 [Adiantum nelumboides]|nr:hypothetical protein [Adiantum nelumboides]